MIEKKITPFSKTRNFLSYMGIKNKTFLYVGLLIALSIMLAVLVFSTVFRQRALSENARFVSKRLENVSTHLDSYVDELSAIANEANYNYYLQNYLLETQGQEEDTISLKKGGSVKNYEMGTKIFSYALNDRTDVSTIMIFGRKQMLLYKSLYSYRNVPKNYIEYAWYQKAIDHPGRIIVTGPQIHEFLEGNTERMLSFSRVISSYEDGSFLGVILIDVNLNRIQEICSASYTQEQERFCILDEEGNPVYELIPPKAEPIFSEENIQDLQTAAETPDAAKMVKLSDGKYQIGSMKIEKTGWTLVSATPSAALMEPLNTTILSLMLTGAVLAIVVILVLNSILTKVVQPIIILKQSMDEAEESNLKVRVPVMTADEVGKLAKSYNKMMDRIENLMKQVVTEQEEKRKFELQALQAQINPHFLYNTLDSIIWMAEMKNDNVVPMTEALARLFRISLNKGKEFIALEDEIEHVRNYLIIQSMRYLNKFDYEIAIADDVLKCRTIKLIIQPIVENCIYHGIKKQKGKGRIVIQAYAQESKLIIEIADDGAGMPQEVCDSILRPDAKQENITGSGVGVRNVNERIKLYYGEAYGLHFESEQGKGTRVTISLPSQNGLEVQS